MQSMHNVLQYEHVKFICLIVSAPDQLYEVKVWPFNKQTEGYPAVWKGRTEKLTRGACGCDEIKSYLAVL